MYSVRGDIQGTGTIVEVRRPGNASFRLDLDLASKAQLKALYEAGHPFVVKDEAPVKKTPDKS